jgi:pimeloyl-ACP methyl ester carboxylesterase
MLPVPRVLWGVRHFLSLRRAGAEAMVRAHDFAHVDELVRRWSPAWSVPAGETAAVKEAFRQPGCLSAALGYYRALGFSPPAVLRRPITVPGVAFSGADDGILERKDYERARRMYRGPYEIVHLPGGHFLHREHPARFIQELLRVLGSPTP